MRREEAPLLPLLRGWRQKYGRLTLRLLWDLFMVWVALINLGLILFDLTYLWLRPVYFQYVPVVTRIYDPVKGIEPHPLTERFLAELDATRALAELAPGSPELAGRIEDLRALTRRILVENPFERAGLGHHLELFKQALAREIDVPAVELSSASRIDEAAEAVWSGGASEFRSRLQRLERELRPLLEQNYFREFDRNGQLVDHFWMLDLPFLLLFWTEFMVRWVHAIRHRTYARWFFFPIFNWYDVLGLIPVTLLRPFRLLRLVSMYMRLRRSELSGVGRDVFSRTVAYISNIVTEEVSDRVAVRILEEFAEEIRDGTHRRIVRETVGSRRREIERVVASQVRGFLTDPELLARFRELARLNLANAIESAETLRAVPLPNAVLRPVIRVVGDVVLDTTLETIRATLDSDEGQEAVRSMAAAVIDRSFTGPGLQEAEVLIREISLNVIEEMKATVAVKKWALPEDERRPHSLAEAFDEIAETATDREEGEAPRGEREA